MPFSVQELEDLLLAIIIIVGAFLRDSLEHKKIKNWILKSGGMISDM